MNASVKVGARRPREGDKEGWANDHPNARKKVKTKAVPSMLKARGGAIPKNQNPRQRPVQSQPLKEGKSSSASSSSGQRKRGPAITQEDVRVCERQAGRIEQNCLF